MIRFVFRWLFRLFFLAVVVVVILVLSFDSIVRLVMEQRIQAQTGMDAEIGRVSVGFFKPQITILDLKLFNPPAYGGTPLLVIPEIHVEYDRLALVESRFHLTLVRFNLAELDIVKNDAGHTNLMELGLDIKLPAKNAGASPPPAPNLAEFQSKTGLVPAGVDVLNLSIGTLKYLDLKDSRNNLTQKIGIENLVIKNVRGPADLAGLAMILSLRSGDFFTRLQGPQTNNSMSGLLKLLY